MAPGVYFALLEIGYSIEQSPFVIHIQESITTPNYTRWISNPTRRCYPLLLHLIWETLIDNIPIDAFQGISTAHNSKDPLYS